jgi:hypothetical protein
VPQKELGSGTAITVLKGSKETSNIARIVLIKNLFICVSLITP